MTGRGSDEVIAEISSGEYGELKASISMEELEADDELAPLCELDAAAADAEAEQLWEELAAAAERLRVVHNELGGPSRSEADEEAGRVREETAKLRALLKRLLAAPAMPAASTTAAASASLAATSSTTNEIAAVEPRTPEVVGQGEQQASKEAGGAEDHGDDHGGGCADDDVAGVGRT